MTAATVAQPDIVHFVCKTVATRHVATTVTLTDDVVLLPPDQLRNCANRLTACLRLRISFCTAHSFMSATKTNN